MNSSDSRGRPVSYNLGDPGLGLNVQFTYDAQGRLAIKTTVQMKQTCVFDPNSGNLSSRDYRTAGSQTGLYETFGYDPQNRLTSSTIGNNTSSVTYSANGNISTKSNVGGYTYDPTKVNAVSNITVSGGTIDPTQQSITYNALNLTTQITQGATVYNIKYNPFNERIKTINNTTAVTKYYSGDYEKKTTSGVTKEYHYINSPYGLVAIIIKDQTATNTYYAETDHLGSIIGLLNSNQTYAERLSYDAWGKRRNVTDWTYLNIIPPTLTDRGFTGHEHLDSLGLINMNGRIYDPVIGRFLGVDPIIADGDNSQSFNSYTYALNNPLRLIDRDGFKYEEPVTGGPYVGSISTWSLDTWCEMKRLAKDYDKFTYLDCVGIATGSQDAEDVFVQRWLQLQYGPKGQGGDLTSSFNNYISSTQKRFSGVGDVIDKTLFGPSAYAAKLYYFYQVNMHDKSLNPKADAQSPFYRGGYFNGRYMKGEDFGNYNYGVAARSLGISLGDALWGAGASTFILKGSSHTWWNVPGFFDEWNDSKIIIRGYLQLEKK